MLSSNPVLMTPEEQEAATADFVVQHARGYDAETDTYDRPPFSSDVKSPGRSDFYNLHYYLTKVPPESIVGLLLHYTNPGDLVVDPFCGSGMTGVACQMCTDPDPAILAENSSAQPGARVALLSDLSPAACHLSYNYTHPVAPDLVKRAFATILAEVKDKIEALYSTDHFEPACDLYTLSRPEVAARLGDTSQMLMSRSSSEPGEWQLVGKEAVEQYLGCWHPNDREAGAPNASSLECDWIRIPAILSYVVWSDVYRCEGFKTVEEPTDRTSPRTGKRVMIKRRVARGCRQEIVARGTDDKGEDDGNNAFLRCPHCNERWMKGRVPRISIVPVEEVYEYEGIVNANGRIAAKRIRGTRPVFRRQREHIENLRKQSIPCWFPPVSVNRQGPRYRRDSLAGKNINTYSDCFTHRNLWAMALLWDAIGRVHPSLRPALQFCFTSQVMRCSRLRRMKGAKPGEQLSGTLHIASETVETNVLKVFGKAVENYLSAVATARPALPEGTFVHLGTATDLHLIPKESVDYVFTDPPFGSNIYYSEVTFMWEAWFGRFTDEAQEAIMHRPVDGGYKRLEHYATLMDQAFSEIYRILKPGRWATVEFNNSDGKVFEVIKAGLVKCGFQIQNMLVFDKVERTYAQIRSTTGVSDVVDGGPHLDPPCALPWVSGPRVSLKVSSHSIIAWPRGCQTGGSPSTTGTRAEEPREVQTFSIRSNQRSRTSPTIGIGNPR